MWCVDKVGLSHLLWKGQSFVKHLTVWVNVLFIYPLFSFSSLLFPAHFFHFCEDETSGKDVFHRSGETPSDSTGTYFTGIRHFISHLLNVLYYHSFIIHMILNIQHEMIKATLTSRPEQTQFCLLKVQTCFRLLFFRRGRRNVSWLSIEASLWSWSEGLKKSMISSTGAHSLMNIWNSFIVLQNCIFICLCFIKGKCLSWKERMKSSRNLFLKGGWETSVYFCRFIRSWLLTYILFQCSCVFAPHRRLLEGFRLMGNTDYCLWSYVCS